MLTIFTPVYNRAYIIPQLYASLCRQTSKDFEWLIVDDGSTDDIDTVVKGFILENKIHIRYIQQHNGGKHRAINRGVREAAGDLFFIVDSDDYLTDNAVEWILNTAKSIMPDRQFAGLSGTRIYPDGHKIGGDETFETIDANAIEIRTQHDVKGDLAEVFKTEVLRKYPFPEFPDEKFCPEALVWNRIARNYKLRYCNHGIYVCKYLADGLTANIARLRYNSPRASMTFYSEQYHSNIPFRLKLKSAINFHRFSPRLFSMGYGMNGPLSLLMILPGKLMRQREKNLFK